MRLTCKQGFVGVLTIAGALLLAGCGGAKAVPASKSQVETRRQMQNPFAKPLPDLPDGQKVPLPAPPKGKKAVLSSPQKTARPRK